MNRESTFAAEAAWERELLAAVLSVIARGEASSEAAALLARCEPSLVLGLLSRHRLGSLWLAASKVHGHGAAPSGAVHQALERGQRYEVARVLQQEAMARRAGAAFDRASVPYAFFKGVHLRRWLYPVAALRPADDVDVLVMPSVLSAARSALLADGFELAAAKDGTHEETYAWREGYLDLHWSPFRPGRGRWDATPLLLQSRRKLKDLSVLTIEHELLLLLLGTALSDYVTARLIRAVDIDRVVRRAELDWSAIVGLARRLGLGTAAWCSLQWVHGWLRTPVPRAVWEALEPGPVRRAYLRRWLAADPWRVYGRAPALGRLGFSLALQDSARDMLRAAGAESFRRIRKR